MKVLALDISTKAGWALLETSEGALPKLISHGIVQKDKTALEYGPYPEGYVTATAVMAQKLKDLIIAHKPDRVVIEETNQTKSRYVQKMLEWIHLHLLTYWWNQGNAVWPAYISTGTWKSTLGLKKPPAAKANDALLRQARARVATGVCTLNEAKKQLGIRGKWNKKMLAVNWVNENYGLKMKLVNNDEAEAICLGVAFTKGALLCDGDPNRGD